MFNDNINLISIVNLLKLLLITNRDKNKLFRISGLSIDKTIIFNNNILKLNKSFGFNMT